MDIEAIHFDIIGSRPAEAPEGAWIFNAPRPLYGAVTWQGEFVHGIFYAAILPADDYAENFIRQNVSLDGWVLCYFSKEDARKQATESMIRDGADASLINDFSDLEIAQSWHYLHPHERRLLALPAPSQEAADNQKAEPFVILPEGLYGVVLECRDRLRGMGYRAKIVNGSCFDIHQEGNIHYLSLEEGIALSKSSMPHPADLMQYGRRNGLNYWYTFPQAQEQRQ